MKRYITEKEVAKRLNRKPETIRYWRKKGTGPEYIVDPKGRVHYDEQVIQSWIEGGNNNE